MTKEQIIQAIRAGLSVRWHNLLYKLVLDDNFDSGIGVVSIHNNYYSPLLESEFDDCYIID